MRDREKKLMKKRHGLSKWLLTLPSLTERYEVILSHMGSYACKQRGTQPPQPITTHCQWKTQWVSDKRKQKEREERKCVREKRERIMKHEFMCEKEWKEWRKSQQICERENTEKRKEWSQLTPLSFNVWRNQKQKPKHNKRENERIHTSFYYQMTQTVHKSKT